MYKNLMEYYIYHFRGVSNSTKAQKESEKMENNYLISQENRKQVCRYCSDNFKRLRKILGMNQSELAMAVGTTQRHISEIENGKAKVSWTLMLALSTIFIIHEKTREDYRVMKDLSAASPEGQGELDKILQELRECGWLVELSAAIK